MTVNYLKMEILRFQSHANLLHQSSLKDWVRDSAFSVYRFLIPTPQIHYRYKRYLKRYETLKMTKKFPKEIFQKVFLYIQPNILKKIAERDSL